MYICPSSTFSHTVTLQRWVIQAAARIRLLLFHAFAQPAFDEAREDTAALSRQAERLLSQHGDSILRLAYAYLHNMSDAEDVLQDTLLQFLKTAPVLENPDHEKAWLLRVAVNRAKDITRSFWRRNKISIEEYAEEIPFENQEDRELFEAVMKLPEKYRDVIHLYYYEELSVKEIAGILGASQGSVKMRLSRGRSFLRDVFKEEEG